MVNNKIPAKCPYCNKNTVRKSDGEISLGKIGKGLKLIIDIFTTVYQVNPNVSNLSNILVSEDDIGDCVGTECFCESCKRTFTLLRRYDSTHNCTKIECLKEDTPENIKKKYIQANGLYKITIISLNTHFFKGAEKGHYADVLMDMGDYYYYDAFKAFDSLPFVLRFQTKEKRDAYAKFLKSHNCRYNID